jgi:hypothetical protein
VIFVPGSPDLDPARLLDVVRLLHSEYRTHTHPSILEGRKNIVTGEESKEASSCAGADKIRWRLSHTYHRDER